jgi:hypothetical protein
METWANFKRLADRTDVPEDVRNFILKFGPPSVERYPAAYRIYRPRWYSKRRLFILWGLEPVGGAEFVSMTAEEAITEAAARTETESQEASGNLLHWLKIALGCLLGFALLLLLLWVCLPRPVVDFQVSAEADKPAKVVNLTSIDRSLDWGRRDNHWVFNGAKPERSDDFEPAPIWSQAGAHEVTLEVTQSTFWGLLHKTESLSKVIVVTDPPARLTEKGKAGPNQDGEIPGPSDKDGPKFLLPWNPKQKGEMDRPGPREPGQPVPPGGSPDGRVPLDKPLPPDRKGDMSPNPPGVPPKTQPANPQDEGGGPKMIKPYEVSPEPLPGKGQSVPKDDKGGMSSEGRVPLGADSKVPDQKKLLPSGPSRDDNSQPKSGPDKQPMMVAPSPAPDGQPSPMPKQAPEEQAKGGKMSPGADGSTSSSPQSKPNQDDGGKVGTMTAPGLPAPGVPPGGRPGENLRTLPVPSVQIRDITVLAGGDSQDIDFALNLPAGVRVERLSVDGKPVAVSSSLGFRARLGVGPHSVRIEYGSPNGDLHGEVTQEVVVDRDEVRIIKPRTRVAPPVQVPGAEQPAPRPKAPSKSRDAAAEKFDKKTA